jgi:hypothetical protein
VPLWSVGIELERGGQAGGALGLSTVDGGVGGEDHLKCLRAPLGERRGAVVVDEVALVDGELTVVGFELQDVGFDGDSLDLGGDVEYGDVAGTTALGRGDEVRAALMSDANEVGAAAGLSERVLAIGIGSGFGDFAHAGLDVDEDDGISGGGLSGGLIGDRTSDSGSLGQRACKEQA